MPIDPSIALGIRPAQITTPDPIEQYGKVLQLKTLMGQQQLQGIQTQEAQQSLSDQQSIRSLLANGNVDVNTPEGQAAVVRAGGKTGIDMLKNLLAPQQARAEILKNTAQAGNFDQEALTKAIAINRDQMGQAGTPDQARQIMAASYQDPVLGKVLARGKPLDQALADIPDDPTAYKDWNNKYTLGASKYLEQNAPKINVQNLGGSSQIVATPGLGGAPSVLSTTPTTQSPDSVASNQTSEANNKRTNATSRANNRDTIAKDFTVAGINPDGSAKGDTQSLVDAIGQYKVAPPTGAALRNPRQAALMAQVAQQYPDFDATQFPARTSAARAFSTGPQSQQVQAANTALNHLDTLQQLAAAQKNGNIQLFNQISNTLGAQFGKAAPSDLKAAVTMVAPEITKAVVGAGGGVEDRNKAAAALNPNYSPDQMAGAVGTMQDLLGGRLMETQRTYQRSTGRKDFADTFLSPAAQRVLASKVAANPAAAQAGPAPVNGVPATAAPSQPIISNTLPDPAQYAGKKMTDTTTNQSYISQGGKWVRVQ